ncbi:10410_t:CDS:2 [Scutellospora calospora]|uniref:10410_t:CDS:1 n=1 Tax=Scutellospora calospora TaxID=85575 RepID=A0ACA9L4U0_9GLOM|nr:10410_t:CDS:2 [Scutellospora calospora]
MVQTNDVVIDNLGDNDKENSISHEQLIHCIDLVNTPNPILSPFIGLKFIKFIQSLNPPETKTVIETWSSFTNSDIVENLRAGIVSLDNPEILLNDVKHPNFNINRAELLFYTSVLMQERDSTLVDEAEKMVLGLKKIPNNANNEVIKKITDKLRKSEDPIREQAKKLGLEFASITECNVVGGPYGALFWSEGTDPLNLGEWLTNFSLQRIDARSFLFGEVHYGYYTSLFNDNSYSSVKSLKQCPALRLAKAVRDKADEIYKRTSQKVNVWVSGYSLGGALATLFYARLLESPTCLGDHVDIRDGMSFASPVLGNSDFAAGFQSLMNNDSNSHRNFWRVVNDNDIVPRYPAGFHTPNLGLFLSKINLLNYINIGDEVRFYQSGAEPRSKRHLYGPEVQNLFIKQGLGFIGWDALFIFSDHFDGSTNRCNPIKNPFAINYKVTSKFDYFTPGFLRNHLPFRYFESMEKARKYWESKLQNNIIENPENFINKIV